jgi:Rps23 Pro-64 3,4-dihydroxylase Tpa1-like proline 4-hydroxylase
MIRFDKIDSKLEELKQQWNNAEPFEYVVIDNFCDNEKLEEVYKTINGIDKNSVGKSRDYMFAKNKLEKSEFKSLSPELTAIYNDFTSDKFRSMVQHITGFADTFIDPDFHGGGIHMGGEGSFLDMHTDFNIHPKNKWTRELNILLYMNPGWKPEYKGQLKLENLDTGKKAEIEPIWNRCVIMLTKGHTKHGYDPINFPKGTYRTTMATYCYTKPEVGKELPYVSTVWYPSKSGIGKRIIGRHWPKLVNMKSKILPSKTGTNK